MAACPRGRTPGELLATLRGVGTAVNARSADRPWGPVAGTAVLPRQPGGALRDGTAARVPLLVGGTRDEMRAFASGEAALTAPGYHAMMAETFGDRAGVVLAAYPATGYASPALALATALGDWGGFVGACPVLRTAEAAATRQPVYAYEFGEDSGQVTADGFPMGSYHGLDLPYTWTVNAVWNQYPPLTAEQRRLSETVIGYWSAFAHTGDPNGPGRPRWPGFRSASTVIGLSTAGIAPAPYAADHRCDLWATLPR